MPGLINLIDPFYCAERLRALTFKRSNHILWRKSVGELRGRKPEDSGGPSAGAES